MTTTPEPTRLPVLYRGTAESSVGAASVDAGHYVELPGALTDLPARVAALEAAAWLGRYSNAETSPASEQQAQPYATHSAAPAPVETGPQPSRDPATAPGAGEAEQDYLDNLEKVKQEFTNQPNVDEAMPSEERMRGWSHSEYISHVRYAWAQIAALRAKLVEARREADHMEECNKRHVTERDRALADLAAMKRDAEDADLATERLLDQKTADLAAATERAEAAETENEDVFRVLGGRTGEDGDEDLIVVAKRCVANMNDAMKRAGKSLDERDAARAEADALRAELAACREDVNCNCEVATRYKERADALAGMLRDARVYIARHTAPTVVEAAHGSIVNRIDAALAQHSAGAPPIATENPHAASTAILRHRPRDLGTRFPTFEQIIVNHLIKIDAVQHSAGWAMVAVKLPEKQIVDGSSDSPVWWNDAIDACASAIRAAGYPVEGYGE